MLSYVTNLVVIVAATVTLTACAEAGPVKILCMGDSITKGVRPGVTQQESFAALLQNWLSERLVPVEIINEGIGGENTSRAIERLNQDVVARQPDYVTIMYGTTDSAVDKGKSKPRVPVEVYQENLQLIVQQLRAAGICPILMTSPPLGDDFVEPGWSPYEEQGPNFIIVDYIQAMRQVAADEAVPLVDNFARWAELEFLGTDIDVLMVDGCHPNPAGHKLLAQTIYLVLAATLADKSVAAQ